MISSPPLGIKQKIEEGKIAIQQINSQYLRQKTDLNNDQKRIEELVKTIRNLKPEYLSALRIGLFPSTDEKKLCGYMWRDLIKNNNVDFKKEVFIELFESNERWSVKPHTALWYKHGIRFFLKKYGNLDKRQSRQKLQTILKIVKTLEEDNINRNLGEDTKHSFHELCRRTKLDKKTLNKTLEFLLGDPIVFVNEYRIKRDECENYRRVFSLNC